MNWGNIKSQNSLKCDLRMRKISHVLYLCVCVRAYKWSCAFMCTCVSVRKSVCMCINVSVCLCKCVCLCVGAWVRICVCMLECVLLHVSVCMINIIFCSKNAFAFFHSYRTHTKSWARLRKIRYYPSVYILTLYLCKQKIKKNWAQQKLLLNRFKAILTLTENPIIFIKILTNSEWKRTMSPFILCWQRRGFKSQSWFLIKFWNISRSWNTKKFLAKDRSFRLKDL